MLQEVRSTCLPCGVGLGQRGGQGGINAQDWKEQAQEASLSCAGCMSPPGDGEREVAFPDRLHG